MRVSDQNKKISFHLLLVQLCITLFFCTPAQAVPDLENLAQISIIPGAHQQDTTEFMIGLDVQMQDGWKTYWRIPGDLGLPLTLSWDKSRNIDGTPEMIWPTPERFSFYGIQNLGYSKHVLFPVKIIAKDPKQPVNISLDIMLLVCEEICVPVQKTLTATLPPATSPQPDSLQRALRQLPQSNTGIVVQDIAIINGSNDILSVTLSLPNTHSNKDITDIIVYTAEELYLDAPKTTFKNVGVQTLLQTEIPLRIALYDDQSLKDILEKDSDFFLTLDFKDAPDLHVNLTNPGTIAVINQTDAAITVPENISTIPVAPSIWTIFLAFLGGAILNIMPCVLPVLSLKFLSMIKSSDKSAGHIRVGFLASTFGILCAFWSMATLLSILKLGGHSIGWGMQFQHTGFLIFLCAVLLIFGFNLWGLFEIRLPKFIASRLPASQHHDHDSLTGHFLTGVLATLLATPCSAPFLGTAVGFALSQSTSAIFLIFSFLGLGLAAPYILVAVFPVIAQYMPKPGAWMLTVKKIMGTALLLTALWLGSIAEQNIIGRDAVTPAIDKLWQEFNMQTLSDALAKDKTVIVDITADWCITCKANKKLVLDDKDIQKLLMQDHVTALRGDWTQMNENITEYIKSFGRYGIPLNVIYGPQAPNGILLPELLSKKTLKDALQKANTK